MKRQQKAIYTGICSVWVALVLPLCVSSAKANQPVRIDLWDSTLQGVGLGASPERKPMKTPSVGFLKGRFFEILVIFPLKEKSLAVAWSEELLAIL